MGVYMWVRMHVLYMIYGQHLLLSWLLRWDGLGVSGLEPACGWPYPTPIPPVCRGAAEGCPPLG